MVTHPSNSSSDLGKLFNKCFELSYDVNRLRAAVIEGLNIIGEMKNICKIDDLEHHLNNFNQNKINIEHIKVQIEKTKNQIQKLNDFSDDYKIGINTLKRQQKELDEDIKNNLNTLEESNQIKEFKLLILEGNDQLDAIAINIGELVKHKFFLEELLDEFNKNILNFLNETTSKTIVNNDQDKTDSSDCNIFDKKFFKG